jgi:hypothetical protein
MLWLSVVSYWMVELILISVCGCYFWTCYQTSFTLNQKMLTRLALLLVLGIPIALLKIFYGIVTLDTSFFSVFPGSFKVFVQGVGFLADPYFLFFIFLHDDLIIKGLFRNMII